MDSSLSESSEFSELSTDRWRTEFSIPCRDERGKCESYAEILNERRKNITEELQKLLQRTPLSYDAFYQRTQGVLSPIREQRSIDNSQDHESACLQIRSEPIVLQDPCDNEDYCHEVPIDEPKLPPRPFLKRGSGLARFHMTKDDFHKPPDLYRKKEFKSYLKGDRRKCKNKGAKQMANSRLVHSTGTSTCTVMTKPVRQLPSSNNLPPKLSTQIKEATMNTITNRKLVPPPPFKVPKAPMATLRLKDSSPLLNKGRNSQEENENRIFEILEKRVEESDFCSQNTSVQNLFDHTEPLSNNSAQKLSAGQVDNRIEQPVVECNIESKVDERNEDQNDLKIYSEREIALRVKRKDLQDNVKNIFECNFNPRLKTTVRKFAKKVRIKKPVRTPQKENINLRELKIKLEELEKEKNAFQRDNNKLKRIQKDILDEKLQLDKRRKEEEKRLKEQHDQLGQEHEILIESQRKFYREKVAFEKYCKETKNLPSREEREEIRKLKEELENLKEVLTTKEARFGAAQARLRNQIKALETENKQLKSELADAKKSIVKKVSFDSQALINTKVINAINEQLGKKIFGGKEKAETIRANKAPKPKPLRRVKSAVELKRQAVREDASGEVSEEEEECDDEPKIIDMLGENIEESSEFKRCESADSGIGSRPSASDGDNTDQAHRAECDDYCQASMPSPCCCIKNNCPSETLPSMLDLPNRGWTLADMSQEGHKFKTRIEDTCPILLNRDAAYSQNSHHGVKTMEERPINSRLLPNGDIEEIYGNGRKRLVSGSGDFMRIVYPNGDIREQYLRSLREKFFYKDSGVWQTTFTDRVGYQQLDMPDGRTVVYHPDGVVDTLYPNGTTARLDRSGAQEWRFKTGEVVRTDSNGDKILTLPDGRKEYTFKDFKRLEEVDGTIKTLYKDGREETKLPNGRVRVKDRHGNVILDTAAKG